MEKRKSIGLRKRKGRASNKTGRLNKWEDSKANRLLDVQFKDYMEMRL